MSTQVCLIAPELVGTTVAVPEVVELALVTVLAALFVAVYATRRLWRKLSAQMAMESVGNGVPIITIEDYARRRLARGSKPPPIPAARVSLRLRPRLRALTPRPIDTRWDLSWDLSERDR
jgi:hypothetical protein